MRFTMHLKAEQSPARFWWPHIPSIEELFNLVAPHDIHCSFIVGLIDVLVEVLDGLDRCAKLNINMSRLLLDEVRVVRHRPTVV